MTGVKKFMLFGTSAGYDSAEEALAKMPKTPIVKSAAATENSAKREARMIR